MVPMGEMKSFVVQGEALYPRKEEGLMKDQLNHPK
jgi:hypothetical protein